MNLDVGGCRFTGDLRGMSLLERIVEVELNAEEKAMFEKSIASVTGLIDAC